LTGRSCASSR